MCLFVCIYLYTCRYAKTLAVAVLQLIHVVCVCVCVCVCVYMYVYTNDIVIWVAYSDVARSVQFQRKLGSNYTSL